MWIISSCTRINNLVSSAQFVLIYNSMLMTRLNHRTVYIFPRTGKCTGVFFLNVFKTNDQESMRKMPLEWERGLRPRLQLHCLLKRTIITNYAHSSWFDHFFIWYLWSNHQSVWSILLWFLFGSVLIKNE